MVFIIGYVFGPFSKKASLTTITRVAAVLVIVLFVFTNIASFRSGGWHGGRFGNQNHSWYCQDSSNHR
jgi:hypothetical protein